MTSGQMTGGRAQPVELCCVELNCVFLTQNSRKFPSFWGFCTCVYLLQKIHIAQSYSLNLIVLFLFRQFLLPQPKSHSIFAPPTEKSSPHLCAWQWLCMNIGDNAIHVAVVVTNYRWSHATQMAVVLCCNSFIICILLLKFSSEIVRACRF